MGGLVRMLSSCSPGDAGLAASALTTLTSESNDFRELLIDEEGGVDALVALLSSASQDEAGEAAGTLANAAAGSTKRGEVVVQSGCVGPLVGLLMSGEGWAAERAAGALANIASGDGGARQAIIDCGGIGPLVAMLSSLRGLEASRAAAALQNIAFRTDTARDALCKGGALGPLVGVLVSPTSCRMSRAHAAGALGNIAAGSHARRAMVVEAGAVPALVGLLPVSPDDIGVPSRGYAAIALGHIADGCESTSLAVAEAGGVEQLTRLLSSKHTEEPLVAACALRAVASAGQELRERVWGAAGRVLVDRIGAASSPQPLHTVPDPLPQFKAILQQEQMAETLAVVVSGSSARKREAESLGAINAVVSLLAHETCIPAEGAARALQVLVAGNADRARMALADGAAGALVAALAVRTAACARSVTKVLGAMATIAAATGPGSAGRDFVAHGAVPLLTARLSDEAGELAERSALVLAKIACCGDSAIRAVHESGALGSLVPMLSSEVGRRAVNAAACLEGMAGGTAGDDDVVGAIAESGALEPLALMLASPKAEAAARSVGAILSLAKRGPAVVEALLGAGVAAPLSGLLGGRSAPLRKQAASALHHIARAGEVSAGAVAEAAMPGVLGVLLASPVVLDGRLCSSLEVVEGVMTGNAEQRESLAGREEVRAAMEKLALLDAEQPSTQQAIRILRLMGSRGGGPGAGARPPATKDDRGAITDAKGLRWAVREGLVSKSKRTRSAALARIGTAVSLGAVPLAAVVDTGGITALARLVATDREPVAGSARDLLLRLVSSAGDAPAAILRSGTVTGLLAMMEEPSGPLALVGVVTLRAVTKPSLALTRAAVDAGAVARVVPILESGLEVAPNCAAAMLAEMSAVDDRVRREAIACGAIAALVGMLGRAGDDSMAQNAASALSSIMRGDAACARAAVDAGIVPAAALKVASPSDAVSIAASCALASIAGSGRQGARAVATLGAIGPLTAAAARGPDSAVAESAVVALCAVLAHPALAPAAAAAGALEPLLVMVSSPRHTAGVSAARTVAGLVDGGDDDVIRRLLAAGAVPRLVAALSSDTDAAPGLAANCLATIAGRDATARAAMTESAVEVPLVRLLRHRNCDTVITAMASLRGLVEAGGARFARAVVRVGAVPEAARLLATGAHAGAETAERLASSHGSTVAARIVAACVRAGAEAAALLVGLGRSSDGYARALLDGGAVRPLVAWAVSRPPLEGMRVTLTLSGLAVHERRVAEAMVGGGIAPTLVGLLASPGFTPQMAGLSAVSQVLNSCLEACLPLRDAGAVPHLVALLSGGASPALAAEALAILAERVPPLRREAVDAGALGPLVALLGGSDSMAVLPATNALTEVAADDDTSLKRAVFDAGAVPPLLRLVGHPNEDLATAAAIAVGAVLTDRDAGRCRAVAEAGGISVLVRALSGAERAMNAAAALQSIAEASPRLRNAVLSAGAERPLEALRSRSSLESRIAMITLAALRR